MISWYARPADFNPRSHKGSDRQWIGNNDGPHNFNPRSHKGSDDLHQFRTLSAHNFNPRSHKGSDISSLPAAILVSSISIHAPTRGATHPPKPPQPNIPFQSTLPQGERRARLHEILFYRNNFNPRSHKGSDYYGLH